MARVKKSDIRPFIVAIKCKELQGVEYDGHVFEHGIYISMVAASNYREVLEKALGSIANITGIAIPHLKCQVMDAVEVSLERAESFREILQNARPSDEIGFR